MQVELARVGVSVIPPGSLPESEASFSASSAEAAIAGVIDSSGPVKPRMMPTLVASWAQAPVAVSATAAVASRRRFIVLSLFFLSIPDATGLATPQAADRITLTHSIFLPFMASRTGLAVRAG